MKMMTLFCNIEAKTYKKESLLPHASIISKIVEGRTTQEFFCSEN
jgi:hypothetical protein